MDIVEAPILYCPLPTKSRIIALYDKYDSISFVQSFEPCSEKAQ